jgi:hypothetical protein
LVGAKAEFPVFEVERALRMTKVEGKGPPGWSLDVFGWEDDGKARISGNGGKEVEAGEEAEDGIVGGEDVAVVDGDANFAVKEAEGLIVVLVFNHSL